MIGVNVEGYGPGTIVAFSKTYLQGASTHDIEFDSTGEKLTLKLARKSNVSTHARLCRKQPPRKQPRWLLAVAETPAPPAG